MVKVEQKEREATCQREEQGGGEEEAEDDSVELEQRNNDSVFSELSELSHDYVESVDRGASVRGKLDNKLCFRSFLTNEVLFLST